MAIVRVYLDGSGTPAASYDTSGVEVNAAWSLALGLLSTGLHTVQFSTQNTGDTEALGPVRNLYVCDEEEGDLMPAHTVNESTVNLSTASATLAPSSANAKRYMVRIVNTDATNRVFVGYSSGVTTTTGYAIEPDFGVADFFVDNNVTLYAIRAGGTPALRVFEYCTA